MLQIIISPYNNAKRHSTTQTSTFTFDTVSLFVIFLSGFVFLHKSVNA